MSIPDFQTLMLPFLKAINDEQEHSLHEIVEKLAMEFNLSSSERSELLPSGRQRKFENRVGWAKTYLSKACLIEMTGRARFRITQRGKEIISKNLPSINMKYLQQFPEYLEFRSRPEKETIGNEGPVTDADNRQTPEELLEESYQRIRAGLAQELIERLKACSPAFFERLVVELLVAMGYGGSLKDAGMAVGQSGDGGIDGIIKEDKLGLDVVYIQAKRWEGTVGRPVVQAFAGSLEGQRATKGVMITTSRFSSDAYDFVGRIGKKIVLIDGERLAQLMIDHNVGVSEVEHYVIKRIDLDYFEEA